MLGWYRGTSTTYGTMYCGYPWYPPLIIILDHWYYFLFSFRLPGLSPSWHSAFVASPSWHQPSWHAFVASSSLRGTLSSFLLFAWYKIFILHHATSITSYSSQHTTRVISSTGGLIVLYWQHNTWCRVHVILLKHVVQQLGSLRGRLSSCQRVRSCAVKSASCATCCTSRRLASSLDRGLPEFRSSTPLGFNYRLGVSPVW